MDFMRRLYGIDRTSVEDWRQCYAAFHVVPARYRAFHESLEEISLVSERRARDAGLDPVYTRENAWFCASVSAVSAIECIAFGARALAAHPNLSELTFGKTQHGQSVKRNISQIKTIDALSNTGSALDAVVSSCPTYERWHNLRVQTFHRSTVPSVIVGHGADTPGPAKRVRAGGTSKSASIDEPLSWIPEQQLWLSTTIDRAIDSMADAVAIAAS